jgi:hypothetical protein
VKHHAVSLALVTFLASCAPVARVPSRAPAAVVLRGTDGAVHPLEADLHAHPVTVVSFFSAHCPCQAAHDERLRALIAANAPRGVGFLVVDSEESASPDRDAAESRARGYPIVLDDRGALARALGAEYATYSVILGSDGAVLYRGGFDSDRTHLTLGRTPLLAQALSDVLDGRAPRQAETKALGCALELP